MIEPGTIFVPRGSKPVRGQIRVVVYRIGKHGSVYYDGLNKNRGGGGIYAHGHDSTRQFLLAWEPVAKMNFGGAWKRYQQEQHRTGRLRQVIRILWKEVDSEATNR